MPEKDENPPMRRGMQSQDSNRTSRRTPITDQDYRERIDQFNYIKRGILGPHFPANTFVSITYARTVFIRFLDDLLNDGDITGLRIYFACYTTSGDPDVDRDRIPTGYEGRIALVYAPTADNNSDDMEDTGQYYIFNVAGNATIRIGNTNSHSVASAWVSRYQNTLRRQLNGPLVLNQETKSIWYSRSVLKEIRDGIAGDNGQTVTVYFAAYRNKEVIYCDTGKYRDHNLQINVSNKLSLVFGRNQIPLKFFEPNNYDTGAPCPPAEGCGGGLLP